MRLNVLTVGLTYTGVPIVGARVDNLGLCTPAALPDTAAFPLDEYDVIIINPASYSHFLFGKAGEYSDDKAEELFLLKRKNNSLDIDSVFDFESRSCELLKAMAKGAIVVWCLAEPRRVNFYGFRKTWLGYLCPAVDSLIEKTGLEVKKGLHLFVQDDCDQFLNYFKSLSESGWRLGLATELCEHYSSIASNQANVSLAGEITIGEVRGWLVTPPVTPESENQLILDAIALKSGSNLPGGQFRSIFLSHTSADKPFVRQLREDLLERNVPKVWIDEAEIMLGDSLLEKIAKGIDQCQYFGIVLSPRSIDSNWVRHELETAMNRQIGGREVVVLPLLYERCELPGFLRGRLYADFTEPNGYENALQLVLERLRI